jgi:hypothetical protein
MELMQKHLVYFNFGQRDHSAASQRDTLLGYVKEKFCAVLFFGQYDKCEMRIQLTQNELSQFRVVLGQNEF